LEFILDFAIGNSFRVQHVSKGLPYSLQSLILLLLQLSSYIKRKQRNDKDDHKSDEDDYNEKLHLWNKIIKIIPSTITL
jgi:hypothetical protein